MIIKKRYTERFSTLAYANLFCIENTTAPPRDNGRHLPLSLRWDPLFSPDVSEETLANLRS